ncbi:deoxyuridine 5'-triphosphate nucleotidohydrolase, mitochondrial isoform X2 [Mixophyes fleayi]|uniref:deoxyuridine 5'-triphosphate nucleotidohydrolase, mitochondrial isoform X2 n=1 Tax=Mixophyes fleayi TaxID=3061075 RepID=UPI003F4E3EC1
MKGILSSPCFRQVRRVTFGGIIRSGSVSLCRSCTMAPTPVQTSPAKRAKEEISNTPPAVLRFAKLSEHAAAPTRGSALAAGYDLYSAYDYVIAPQDKAIVKTDIQICVPSGCYGRIAPRSGLAAKHFIDVGAGVIDEDYRGNVGVVLFNFGKEVFEVRSLEAAHFVPRGMFMLEHPNF